VRKEGGRGGGGALLREALLLLHGSEAKQFTAATELQEEEEVVRRVEGEIEANDEVVVALLQYAVLGKYALDLWRQNKKSAKAIIKGREHPHPVAHNHVVFGNNFERENRGQRRVGAVERGEVSWGGYGGAEELGPQQTHEKHAAG
jgi:hypothetical protein